MWCKKCGYPLDGLSEKRCPECGRGFDPDDKESFVTESRILREGHIYAIVLGIVAFVSICLPAPLSCIVFPLFGFCAVAIGVMADRKFRRTKRQILLSAEDKKTNARRVLTVLALLAASVLAVMVIVFAISHRDMANLRRKVAESDRVLVSYGYRAAEVTDAEEIKKLASSIERQPNWWSPFQRMGAVMLYVRCFSNGEAWDVIGGGHLEPGSLSGDRGVAGSTYSECSRIVATQGIDLSPRFPDIDTVDWLFRELRRDSFTPVPPPPSPVITNPTRLVQFKFEVDQATIAAPSSQYAADMMKTVALNYTGAELRLFREKFEAHWEKIKDDPAVHADVKTFCQHVIEKIRGLPTTWKPTPSPAAREQTPTGGTDG
jgi:hypothetical protein